MDFSLLKHNALLEKMMSANDSQVGGDHYKGQDIEHWDYCWARKFDFYQYQITKYVERHKLKNGIQDLKKARHFLDKYIEVLESEQQVEQAAEAVLKKVEVPLTWSYEGGTVTEDMYQCKLCRMHMRAPRGELPEHSTDACLTQQGLNRAGVATPALPGQNNGQDN